MKAVRWFFAAFDTDTNAFRDSLDTDIGMGSEWV
jgi:hypothetical protein